MDYQSLKKKLLDLSARQMNYGDRSLIEQSVKAIEELEAKLIRLAPPIDRGSWSD